MSVGRDLYQMLIAGSQAYARWDLEASMSILKNRKKLLIVLALAVPILAACCAEAYVGHEMLGGKAAYAPSFYTTSIFLTSIAVGVAAGLITGCIGAGGGFIITPALMAVGVKGILAVGTDLFHIFAYPPCIGRNCSCIGRNGGYMVSKYTDDNSGRTVVCG